MPKLPWMPFYVSDWRADPALSMCAPATRGVYMDLLCAMHVADRSGQLCGTTDQLARHARCSTVDLVHALTDLKTTGAADVTERNGVVTVVNRRMKREADDRKAANDRQLRCRKKKRGTASRDCHDGVTGESHKSESETPPNPRKRGRRGGDDDLDRKLGET